MFRQGGWAAATDAQVDTVVKRWCVDVVRGLGGLLGTEPIYYVKLLSRPGALSCVPRDVTRWFACVPKADRPQFDADEHLLGFDNGVLELDTGTFRAARRSDHVTQSTGYCFRPPTAEERALVDKIFEQIYPVREERDIVQRFCGYALTGNTEHKLFMALTDRRTGYNGKTTVLSLIRKAMGDYAVDGNKGVPGVTPEPIPSPHTCTHMHTLSSGTYRTHSHGGVVSRLHIRGPPCRLPERAPGRPEGLPGQAAGRVRGAQQEEGHRRRAHQGGVFRL